MVCNLSLGEGITQDLTEKGKSSIVAASLQRGDEKHNSIRSCTKVHASCYKEYTRKSPYRHTNEHFQLPMPNRVEIVIKLG